MLSRLRRARHLARFVLAWFVLSLGVAVASPVVAPKAMQLVCSGPAMKMVVDDGEGGWTDVGHNSLDCPLCATVSGPPAQPVPDVPALLALTQVLRPVVPAGVDLAACSAWQARAPPCHS